MHPALQEQLAILEEKFGNKQKKKEENETVEEKTMLHSTLIVMQTYVHLVSNSSHLCSLCTYFILMYVHIYYMLTLYVNFLPVTGIIHIM